MKMSVKADKANLQAFANVQRKFRQAAQSAIKDAAAEAVTQGRSQIGAAGFSSRWQKGLVSKSLKGKPDQPAQLIFHRIGFFTVFERGATISGKPLLWLPVEENLPASVHSPKQYRGGKLVSATIGGTPFLFSPKDYHKALFVGVPQVKIRKRLSLRNLFKSVAKQLPELLKKHLDALKG
jgi:hypothetical protein